MAQVFAKIFQNKKYQTSGQNSRQQSKSNTVWHVTRFTKDHINLVLFKDCATSGKLPILDSRCIKKVTPSDLLCEKCQKQRRCYKRSMLCRGRCPRCPGVNASQTELPKYKNVCVGNGKNDVKLVGEMIFGTAPLSSSGTTIKVHSLRSPHQLMLSSVFQYKKCKDQLMTSCSDFDSLDSFESSVYGDGLPRRSSENNLNSLGSQDTSCSRPVDMPTLDTSQYGSDTSLNLSATSCGSLPNPHPSPGANSSASINSTSRLNMMRRMRHSVNRSLQFNTSCDSPQPSSLSECGSGGAAPPRRRGARIGMAVMFTLDEFHDSRTDFEKFFFSHITLIEGHLMSLRKAIETNACESKSTEYIMEALEKFRDKVYDLYTAQRLANPVWLSMMATNTQRYRICERFVKEFTILIDRYDSNSTNHFVSTLLTGVLMYHLAWVPTVTPSGEINSTYSEKHSAKWLDMLAKSHPYNPLWAQLSDMYGAIGIPPRLARTVITGKRTDTIIKFLFVLSYFIRCSEIHETLDECFDEENMMNQIQMALDEICVDSMERDATAEDQTDFVLVDAPNTSIFMQDVEGGSDSGLVSQSTGQSKGRRPPPCPEARKRRAAPTDAESGYTESTESGSLADARRVPASSPSDKVREWINTSQLRDVNSPPAISPNKTGGALHRSQTDSTLVNTTPGVGSPPPTVPHSPTSPAKLVCLPPPPEAKCDIVSPVGRSAPPATLPDVLNVAPKPKLAVGGENAVPKSLTARRNLVRLFSSEIDAFDELYSDGIPPSFSRQASVQSTSQFDDLFEDDDLDSFSGLLPSGEDGGATEPPTPTNNRNMLFKVLKESGFHQNAQQQAAEAEPSPSKQSALCRTGSALSNHFTSPSATSGINATGINATGINATGINATSINATGDDFRPRNLSVGKQSSRCSTPQTMCGGATTPCSDMRRRHPSLRAPLTGEEEVREDVFSEFDELDMPRSTNVSKLADTSISTTSFGRQQFASFSDHYLSDFVLHGTSDDEVFSKVQKDLVSSVEHSVLEDRICEAVCVVADTERWTVNVCSSMREQPKPLAASHLVMSMVEAVSNLSKLRMSPEFILMHMEDRLQEMFFKSRMLSEYIKSQKRVDMDELDAMFGMDVSDIRFLLSVACTHSTINVNGIY